jgi:hypothetical protein
VVTDQVEREDTVVIAGDSFAVDKCRSARCSLDRLLMKAISGARPGSGHAMAAPPSSVMNWRLFTPIVLINVFGSRAWGFLRSREPSAKKRRVTQSPHDQRRYTTVGEYLIRLAAEQESRDAAPAV